MKILLNLVFLATSVFSFSGHACTSEKIQDLIYSTIESDEGVGIIEYGVFSSGQKIEIADMERNNTYTVSNPTAAVVSAHGSYHSGYFIIVLEIKPNTCELLEKTFFYEE